MVQKNIVKQAKSQVDVQMVLPWADMEAKWNEVLQRLAADTEIAGFRKGQAPLPMVEQQLGTKLQDEVFKEVMPQALVEALQGSDIVPIDYPQYSIVQFTKGQQLAFRALITARPEVKVGDYKTISVKRPEQKQITDEDVKRVIDDLFNRWKARLPQDQTAPAAPDDAFAKAVGASDLNDLTTKIKQDLEAEAQYNNELDYEEAILQEVEKMTTVEIPEILVEDELRRMLVSLQRRVADMGLLMEDYLRSQQKTLEGLRSEWKPQADKNVRMELGLAEIARMENVDISDAEVQAEIDKITDSRMKAQFEQQEPRLHLKHSLRQVRTLNLLKTLVKAA